MSASLPFTSGSEEGRPRQRPSTANAYTHSDRSHSRYLYLLSVSFFSRPQTQDNESKLRYSIETL